MSYQSAWSSVGPFDGGGGGCEGSTRRTDAAVNEEIGPVYRRVNVLRNEFSQGDERPVH